MTIKTKFVKLLFYSGNCTALLLIFRLRKNIKQIMGRLFVYACVKIPKYDIY